MTRLMQGHARQVGERAINALTFNTSDLACVGGFRMYRLLTRRRVLVSKTFCSGLHLDNGPASVRSAWRPKGRRFFDNY